MVKFVRPSTHRVEYIADNMRSADIAEVWAMSRHSPHESIVKGLKLSNYSAVITIKDVPCAVVGLVVVDILTGTGVPWLLGTDAAVRNKRVFLDNCKKGVDQMLNICPNLYNYVHAENRISVRWLQYMGFKLESPQPLGIDGAMFHKFSMGDC